MVRIAEVAEVLRSLVLVKVAVLAAIGVKALNHILLTLLN
jgi:hypothetical protein